MFEGNSFIDNIMETVFNAILTVLKFFVDIIFSNHIVTFIFWVVIINLLAVFLMKKDKQYAKEGKRRVRELTLIMVALVGGAIGMYFAMYKYKHKTLHKKFTILVPTFIVIHFAMITYYIFSQILHL